ncbi:hypothetical protein [Yoonia sp. MH D7]
MRVVNFSGNLFHGVSEAVLNPASLEHEQLTAASTWTANTSPHLPFEGRARYVESVTVDGDLRNTGNGQEYLAPSVTTGQGTGLRYLKFNWATAVKGKVRYIVRMDNPL